MPNGLAADGTYAAGVRRTFEMTAEDAWRNWSGPAGLARWLSGYKGTLEEGMEAVLADGTRMKVIRVKPPSQLRIRLERDEWPHSRTAQLRVLSAARGVTIALHLERLPDAATRAEAIERWTRVLEGGAKEATRKRPAGKAAGKKAPARKSRAKRPAGRKAPGR
jgi:uncharacterized protein YndB with AHSA1/START domain